MLPVPIELIVVVTGTLVSQFMDLSKNYGIKTIGTIPTGFPAFELPDLDLSKQLVVDGFIIAMVSYTVSVSMALIFAQKLCYEIDFNQELLALGTSNVFGSFFSCLPLSASLSRSAIQESTGGRTQIASLVSCGLLTFVLLWIGPFFELLPKVCKKKSVAPEPCSLSFHIFSAFWPALLSLHSKGCYCKCGNAYNFGKCPVWMQSFGWAHFARWSLCPLILASWLGSY